MIVLDVVMVSLELVVVISMLLVVSSETVVALEVVMVPLGLVGVILMLLVVSLGTMVIEIWLLEPVRDEDGVIVVEEMLLIGDAPPNSPLVGPE